MAVERRIRAKDKVGGILNDLCILVGCAMSTFIHIWLYYLYVTFGVFFFDVKSYSDWIKYVLYFR